jgi:Cellulase (glycosyl hydrolase family 5)
VSRATGGAIEGRSGGVGGSGEGAKLDLISRRAALRAAVGIALGAASSRTTLEARASLSPLRLRRGVNTFPWFSLTREFPAPRTDYDWPPFQLQRPVPAPSDLARLRRIGFDFIRIPVDPGPFLAGNPEQRKSLLGDLSEAVRAALAVDLSVVVNLEANIATHHWTPSFMTGSPRAPGFAAYLDLVAEVARLLSRFAENRVALEPINEPGGACDSSDYRNVRLELLRTARSAASRLTLVATGGCGSLVQGLADFDPSPLERLRPLLFTFHFYEPYLFTHQGAPWIREPIYRSLNAVPWPGSAGSLERTLEAVRSRMNKDVATTAADKVTVYSQTERELKVYFEARPARSFIDRYLGIVDAWAKRHGIPKEQVLMGEFGVLRADQRYAGAAAPDRARYVEDVRRSAEAFGFPWAFWNLFDGMGIMDDRTHEFDPAIVAALGLNVPGG